MESVSTNLLDWGVASTPFTGQTQSGDGALVCAIPGGALVAAADGVGHGPAAAEASRLALSTLERHAEEPLRSLLERCHESLRRTRGAALSMAAFNAATGTMLWLGVGNVCGILLHGTPGKARRMETLVLHGGLVGDLLPAASPQSLAVTPGDTLVLATDGVRSGFAQALSSYEAPREMADRLLSAYGSSTDDALILIARYRGGET